MKISVSLDSIIWGIQYQGGISNYWKKVSNFLNSNDDVISTSILPRSIRYAEYYGDLVPSSVIHKEFLKASISRYCDVLFGVGSQIFHSSYYRAPAFSKAKYVISAYDFIYERYSEGPRLWAHSNQKARSLHKADVVICISDATRKDITNFFPHVNPSKLRTIHLGVDHNTFYPDVGDSDEDISEVVLFVGQRGGYKRFDLAIEAISSCSRLRLGIVGAILSPFEMAMLDKCIPGRWVFFGSVRSEKLRQLYSQAFAFIFPSDFEGFGLPVLEAMACGCPVIASDKGSISEVGGKFVAYAREQNSVVYANCLSELRLSNEHRNNLILGGLNHAKIFTWDNTLKSTIETYYDLLT